MEIIGYLVTGILEIVLCIVISELLDRKLSKKGTEFDSFKRTSSELDSCIIVLEKMKTLSKRYWVFFIIML